MRASKIAVPVDSDAVSELHALVIEPDSARAISSILLFLHGMGEAGSSLGSLPKNLYDFLGLKFEPSPIA